MAAISVGGLLGVAYMAMNPMSTPLADAWEAVPELRRLAGVLQLVSCYKLIKFVRLVAREC